MLGPLRRPGALCPLQSKAPGRKSAKSSTTAPCASVDDLKETRLSPDTTAPPRAHLRHPHGHFLLLTHRDSLPCAARRLARRLARLRPPPTAPPSDPAPVRSCHSHPSALSHIQPAEGLRFHLGRLDLPSPGPPGGPSLALCSGRFLCGSHMAPLPEEIGRAHV